jgi:hypothetical protein
MDILSFFIILFLIHSSINIGHLLFFSITFKNCASSIASPISSETLYYANIVCCQSLRKFATLFLLCILHFFQSLFKILSWSPLQISFWNEFVFHIINFLSFELTLAVFLFVVAPSFSLLFVVAIFPLLFVGALSFSLLFLLRRVFYYCCVESPTADLFVVQSFLLLPIPVHCTKFTILLFTVLFFIAEFTES